MESRLTKAALAVFFISLIILSIIQIEDTDTWVHLSIGREMFRLHDILRTEPFVYPGFGQVFQYSSWLFALLLYVTYLVGGYAGIVLLKATIVCLTVTILYWDSISPSKERLAAVMVLTVFVFTTRFRFVERPDIVLMALMSFTVYALNAYLYQGRKYIYALPLVATIWAGSHSSFILIPVPFIAFIAGGLIQLKFRGRMPQASQSPTARQIKIIALIFVLSMAATLINPSPLAQYTIGYGALTSKWAKEHIVELGPLKTGELLLLWSGIIVTLLSFILNRKRFSLIHLLLVLPFLVLPFSARRFLFIAVLVAAPVIARNIAGVISGTTNSLLFKTIRSPITTGIVIAWIFGYTALGLAGIQPIGYEFKLFGLGVNESRIPAGAVRYMDENGIYGKTFNPFHWGGYLIWSGYPQRSVFIDPRGGLPEILLEKYSLVAASGNLWMLEQLFREFQFDAVILDYPSREEGTRNMNGLVLTDPNWALVYWDDTALLYLRRRGRYQTLIDKDDYRFVIPAQGRAGISSSLGNPALANAVELDLRRSIQRNPSATGLGLLGHLHSKTGRYAEAIAEYTKVLEYPRLTDKFSAYTGLGTVYYQLGDMTKSLSCYEKAIKIQKDGMFLYNLATIYVAKGDNAKAIKTLLEAVRLAPDLEPAQALLAATYKRLGKQP